VELLKLKCFFFASKRVTKTMAYRGYVTHEIDFWTALETMGEVNVDTDIEMISGDTIKKKMATLSMCICCDRHTTNKIAPCKSNGSDNYVLCECDCRHLARIICRTC
jgi:hypothetical protein